MRLDELNAAASPTGAEIIVVMQGGVTLRTTASALRTWIQADLITSIALKANTADVNSALAGKANVADGITSAERSKLDGIAVGATANSSDAALRDRASHTGTQAISTVTGLQAALDGKAAVADGITSAERTKLAGVAVGATANATDAELRDRSTHTGSQLAATISDFASAVAATASVTALAARMEVVEITQAAYDALDPPDPNTLYVVIG